MGLVNGNQGVVSTCLGEITDRSNQSRAFTYLPVIYGIGGITGPILGGLLASKDVKGQSYPFLAPNLVSAAILIGDFIIISIFLEESVEGAEMLPRIYGKFRDMFTWLWQFHSSSRPTYLRNDLDADYPRRSVRHGVHHYRDSVDSDDDNDETDPAITPLFPHRSHNEALNRDEIFNRDMILLLLTYLIFSLSNVSFNSLYPIFAQAPPPTGREFNPKEIGMSLAFAGIVTIVFQICVFGRLRDKMGNRWSYRAGLLGFVASFILMPFISYKDKTNADIAISKQNVLVAVEVCVVLLIKTVATVGGLTSALLLVRVLPYDINYTLTSCIANFEFIDHQFCPRPLCSRLSQWPCADPLCSRPCCRAIFVWKSFHPCHKGKAEGRSSCIRRFWWSSLCRILA